MDGYRKENKYIVDDGVLLEVRNRINSLMQIDPHQKGDFYFIRSIYLDSPDYRSFRENLAGVSPREKLRIRIYNGDASKISAEIKIRHRETISKLSADISQNTYNAIIHNDLASLPELIFKDMESEKNSKPTKKKALEKYLMYIMGEGYAPACMVNYERCAYVYEPCNVRITFDRNVETTRNYEEFFCDTLPAIPVFENGMHVLEVKYDEFLPDVIREMLGGVLPPRTNCSKYANSIIRIKGTI